VAARESFGAAGVYWGTIQAAVNARLTTQELYSALYNAAFAETGQVPKFGFSEVTALRSQAVRNREAEASLSRAEQTAAIGPEHIGAIPRAMPLGNLRDPRRYLATFEHIVDRNGQRVVETRTSVFQYGLPPTKQSLLNQLNRDGAALADEYEDELHIGIGTVRLLAA
jgi:hypothetical protein